MYSTIIEVDEDVFQITTQHEDGSVTVDLVFGQDAYEAHKQKAMQHNGRDTGPIAGDFSARNGARRVAGTSGNALLLN